MLCLLLLFPSFSVILERFTKTSIISRLMKVNGTDPPVLECLMHCRCFERNDPNNILFVTKSECKMLPSKLSPKLASKLALEVR